MSATERSEPDRLPVTLILRRPVPGWHSIETVFRTVAEHLPPDVDPTFHVVPRRSTGVVGRLVNLRDAFRLRRRPGLLHVTGDVQYLALVLPRARTILTVHDLGTLSGGGWLRRTLIALLWFHLPVRWAARTTAVSTTTRDALVGLIPSVSGRIRAIPNPVAPDLQPRAPKPIAPRPMVLAVGATPNKNLDRLAAAVAPLDIDLRIVGDVPDSVRSLLRPVSPTARARLSATMDVPRSELLAAYAAADAVALVSTSEGFGLPVVEAQAIGVPVVASSIAPIVEVGGGAVQEVDPEDVASIRAGLRAVLTDERLRARLIRDGLANAARFDAGRIARAYSDVYRQVVAVSGPGA